MNVKRKARCSAFGKALPCHISILRSLQCSEKTSAIAAFKLNCSFCHKKKKRSVIQSSVRVVTIIAECRRVTRAEHL